jgi:hypothetical protein
MSNPSAESNPAQESLLELVVPPWILIHDDQSELSFVNSFLDPSSPFTLTDRQTGLKLFEFLQSATNDPALTASLEPHISRFIDLGILMPAAELESALHGQPGVQLPFGRFEFEVDASIDLGLFDLRIDQWLERMSQLDRTPQSVVVHFFADEQAAIPLDWSKCTLLAERFLQKAEEFWKPNNSAFLDIEFRAVTNLCAIDEAALAFAERFSRSTVRPRLDHASLASLDDRASALSQTTAIAAEGFDVEVELRTSFDGDLRSLGEEFIRRGHVTAIAVVPLFPRAPSEVTDPRFLSEWVNRAITAMIDLSGTLGSTLHRSEPWKSTLSEALVPLHGTTGWNRKQAIICLSADGRWSRSRAHAAAAIHSSLDDLLTRPVPGSSSPWDATRIDPAARFEGAPECDACEVLALCRRYWTPDLDVAIRRDERTNAQVIARYECETKRAALRVLVLNLNQTRRSVRTAADSPTLRAVFDQKSKRMEIQSGPRGE